MGNVKYKPVTFKAKDRDKNGVVEFSGIGKIDVENDDHGDYHLITFVLDDKTDLDLQFRPITTNLADSPFWIQPIAKGCPKTGAQMKNVVEPLVVSPSGKELTVINYNAKVEELQFALRMVDSSGKGHDYDPIMNNQNGGGRFGWSAAAAVVAGAAAVGAIAYFGLKDN